MNASQKTLVDALIRNLEYSLNTSGLSLWDQLVLKTLKAVNTVDDEVNTLESKKLTQ